MRKSSKWRGAGLLVCLLMGFAGRTQTVPASDVPANGNYATLSTMLLERAQTEVEKIRALVADGTLPKSRLAEAELALADAQDQFVLSQTLYGDPRVEDLTSEQVRSMVEAAERRVERQSKLVAERQNFVEDGILAKSEFAVFQDELASRERVLDLARNRARLFEDLKRMAAVEQRFERAAQSGAELRNVMIRYEGGGIFQLGELTEISERFQKRFRHPLPVSALGQTQVHEAMGLDHRNRVDVALNPDQPEGLWLRQLLESEHIPYLAFRSAVAGAATAPHIHIGTGSTRLKVATR